MVWKTMKNYVYEKLVDKKIRWKEVLSYLLYFYMY